MPRTMRIEEVRYLAYEALVIIDGLIDEYDPDEQPCDELVNIRANLFQLASGVVWEDMQPKTPPLVLKPLPIHGGFEKCLMCGGPTGANGECIEYEQLVGEAGGTVIT